METKFVWYVCYGSNLSRERFMYYIKGGTMPSGKFYKGCFDKSEPIKESPITINYPLYFAKKSSTWNNGAVAFLGHENTPNNATLGKRYLITEEQFKGVVNQENSREAEEPFVIDYDNLSKVGQINVEGIGKWYGRLVYLGDFEGYPAFTFTATWGKGNEGYNSPDESYLSVIIKGIKEAYPEMAGEDIGKYLLEKDGIRETDAFSPMELADLVERI